MSVLVKDDIHSVGTSLLAIGVGATIALYIPNSPYQNYIQLRYVAGGTLTVIGTPQGQTLTGAQLATGATGYLMGATETLLIAGRPAFYLCSLGATTLISQLIGFSPQPV